MSTTQLSPGDHVGRFRVVARLGQGGMGVVYQAVEETLDRQVALKVISPQFADDPDFRNRFISEARALASLDSPHVVQVYAHGEEDGFLYIATQLVPDGDLGQMIRRWGAAPVGKAVDLIEQVASGLADAHAAGLVHRDIKPANVLVRRRGSTVYGYLGDFGIARRVDAEVTRVGQAAIGTPSYMAPELHRGGSAGVATDIYSTGCLLWITLTGAPPYPGASDWEIVNGHLTAPIPQLVGSTPLILETNRILTLALAKDPAQRYPTASALHDDLRRAATLTDDGAFMSPAVPVGGSPATRPRPSVPTSGTPTPGTPTPGTPSPSSPTPAYYPAPAFRPAPAPGQPAAQPSYQPPQQPPFQPAYAAAGGPSAGSGGSRALLWIGLGLVAVLVIGGAVVGTILATSGGSKGSDPAFAGRSAQSIIDAAQSDMDDLDSVRIAGNATENGDPARIDMTITTSGDCDGTIGIGDGSAALRSIDGTTWFRPDDAFWKKFAGAGADLVIAEIGGKWVVVNSTEASDFAEVCDLDSVLHDSSDGTPSYTKDGTGDVDGTAVVKVLAKDDSGTSTVYVAQSAPHYVLKVDGPADEGSFTFSDFGKPFTATAPPDDEVTTLPGS